MYQHLKLSVQYLLHNALIKVYIYILQMFKLTDGQQVFSILQ